MQKTALWVAVLLGLSCLSTYLCQSGELYANMRCVADIALLIDKSGSITDPREGGKPQNWEDLKDFVFGIFDSVEYGPQDVQLGGIFFANQANIKFYFDTCGDVECLKNIVNTKVSRPAGETNTNMALQSAINEVFTPRRGDRPDVRDIIIIITDGKPNPHREQQLNRTVDQVKKERGVRVLGIGIGDKVDDNVMHDIVSSPYQTHYFKIDEFSELSNMLDFLIQQTCMVEPEAPAVLLPPAKKCKEGGDIAFVIDRSGSIGNKNFQTIREFLGSLVQDIPVEDRDIRVATVCFSDSADILFDLSKYKSRYAMRSELEAMDYTGGGTNTQAALQITRQQVFSVRNGDRPDRDNVVLVITDGNSESKLDTLREAILLKQRAHVIVIQVGTWVDDIELNSLASYPHQRNKIKINDFDALPSIRDMIHDLLCDNRDQCENVECQNGGTCVSDMNGYRCMCRDGYAGRHCDERCRMESDIIFAIDRSGSIGLLNFSRQLDFVRDVVNTLNFDMHRVGVMSFATNSQIHFNVDKYNTRQQVVDATNIHYGGGTTNTAGALLRIRDEMFTDSRKRRDNRGRDVPRVVVLVTDGRSDDEIKTWQASLSLKKQGIIIVAVAIGDRVRLSELHALVTDPADRNVFRVENFNSLSAIIGDITRAVCNSEDECQEGRRCENGATCVDKINGKRCICPEGYSGDYCERACNGKFDLVILLDTSGSIRSERFPHVKDFIIKIVENITVGPDAAQIGLVSWSSTSKVEFPFDRYNEQNDVIAAIRAVQFVGDKTNTYAALVDARTRLFSENRGDRHDAEDFALVFTDGGSNINPDRTIPEAVRLKERGVHVSVIAVGDDMNPYEVRGIVSDPTDANILWTLSYKGLPALIEQAWKATCNDVNECASNPCRNGGTCVDRNKMYQCRCPDNYVGVNCERRCSRQMDVAFLLDTSGSVDVVYNLIVNFTKHAIMGLPMHFGRTRVGAITYADRAEIIFGLNDHRDMLEVLNALVIDRPRGATNTQAALRLMYESLFTSWQGDRDRVDNVAILVSDGMSNVDAQLTDYHAEKARERNIEIYTIAVGNEVDMQEMNDIASDPDSDHVIRLPKVPDIPKAADDLMEMLCK